MTRLFLDTEFAEDGTTIDLISIGVVSEGGQEFYRQLANADLRRVNSWVRENVLPKLTPCPLNMPPKAHMAGPCPSKACPWRPRYIVKRELQEWVKLQCAPGNPPEWWGFYADYDWVAICFLFGRMVDLPPNWPMYCRDLKQLCDDLGNPQLPPEGKGEHNALDDARWNRTAWGFLDDLAHEKQMEMRRVLFDAGQRDQQEVSARQVNQESGNIRSAEGGRQDEIGSSGDQQRGLEEDRQTGRSPGLQRTKERQESLR